MTSTTTLREDSLIEVSASLAALFRLYRDRDECHRERAEQVTLRFIGVLFPALAAYIAGQGSSTREEE